MFYEVCIGWFVVFEYVFDLVDVVMWVVEFIIEQYECWVGCGVEIVMYVFLEDCVCFFDVWIGKLGQGEMCLYQMFLYIWLGFRIVFGLN